MRAWASRPQATPRAQLPEGSSAIQMMENPLLSLKSIIATWQSSSPSWVVDTIFGILCGMLLFLVLLSYLERNPSLPPPGKHRNIRKHPMEPKRRSRCRKRSGALKACRECLQELEEARGLISLLGRGEGQQEHWEVSVEAMEEPGPQVPTTSRPTHLLLAPACASIFCSHLGRPLERGGFHQLSCQDSPGEVCKAAPAGVHQACGEPVEDSAPATSPSAPLAPLTLCPLPPASTLPAEHQDQSDLKGIPLGTVEKSSPSSNSLLASPNPAISGLGSSSCPISALSWWRAAATALYLSTSSRCESQQKHLSHHPPKASFQGDPADRQPLICQPWCPEAGSPSFVNPGVQKLLEILLTKRAELKLWKEKGKEGSFSKQMNAEYHLNSLGNMWKALGAEQDTTTHQPFWNMKDKQEQVQGPQQFSHLKFLEDHLQQECSQLFWGLPSLHSESLVATAWAPKSSSYLQPLSVLFNGTSNHFPVPTQPRTPSGLPEAPPLPLPGAQPQPLTGNLPQSQPPPLAQLQTQTNITPVISSLSIQLPSSPHQIRTSGVSCPASQNKNKSFIPTEIQHLKWPLLQKQQKSEKALPSVSKRSQDFFSQPTPNLPQNSGASHGHKPVFQRDFTSPNLQKQYFQKRIIKDEQWGGLHFKIQVSLNLKQAPGQFPWVCQAQDKQGPLRFSASASKSSQDSQKMESKYHRKSHEKDQLKKDFTRGVQQCTRGIPKGLSRDSARFAVNVLGINSKKKSERYLKSLKSDPGTCLPRSTNNKHPEKLLKAHLGRKLEQINQGLIPVTVSRSLLADNHAFPKRYTHMETRNLAPSKDPGPHVNTSCELPFLNPSTQQVLEAHIVRFQVKYELGLPLQAFEPINLKLLEVEHSHLPQSPSPISAVCVSGVHSKSRFTKVLGKPPQAFSEEVITKESFLTPAGLLPTSSSVFEEIQKVVEGTPSGHGPGLSEVPLTREESKLPSQPLTLSLKGRTQQIGTVMGVEEKSLEPNPSSAVAGNESKQERGTQTSGDFCQMVAIPEMNLLSQSSRAEEIREAKEAEEIPAWEVIVESSMLANMQTINMDTRKSGSPGPSKSSSPPAKSVAQDPEEQCLTTKMANKFELQGEVESGDQLEGHATGSLLQDCHTDVLLQDYATGMLIQDDATNVLLQDPHTNMLLAANILASHRALPSSQRENTSEDMPAAQVPSNLIFSGWNSQGQQEPRISKVKDPWKSQRKIVVPTDKREDNRRPKPGKCKEELAEQASGMSNPPQVTGIGDILERKCLQLLSEKGQVFTECHFKEKMRHYLLDKGQEDPLQKGQPTSAIARSQEPVKNRSDMDNGPTEAQAIITAVGQILVEKLSHHQGHTKEINQHKKQFQAPVCGFSSYHKVLSSPEQKRVMKDMAYSHQATPNGHNSSNKSW